MSLRPHAQKITTNRRTCALQDLRHMDRWHAPSRYDNECRTICKVLANTGIPTVTIFTRNPAVKKVFSAVLIVAWGHFAGTWT